MPPSCARYPGAGPRTGSGARVPGVPWHTRCMLDHPARTPCPACHAAALATDPDDGPATGHAGGTGMAAHRHIRNANDVLASLRRGQNRVADSVTSFAGSLPFVYLHAVWFGIWIVVNTGALGRGVQFDPYPFGLLTMIVSLEAIFLSTFVMVSQNRQALHTELRSQLDYEANLRSEIWSVHIGQALGVDPDHVERIVGQAIAVARQESGTPR